jgi:hypothetical protein
MVKVGLSDKVCMDSVTGHVVTRSVEIEDATSKGRRVFHIGLDTLRFIVRACRTFGIEI